MHGKETSYSLHIYDFITSGKISNAKSIEINGYVEADLATEKVTIGSSGKFLGKVDSELVVIAGEYEGKMKADSVWLTETSRISGEVKCIHHKYWIVLYGKNQVTGKNSVI